MEDDKPKTEAKPKAEAKSPKGPSATEAKAARAVEKFIASHLRNSDFSRDTAAWNHFQAGLPVLIGYIAEEMEG